MLVISGYAYTPVTHACTPVFQSRNRDACHFRGLSTDDNGLLFCFNLAIEMLVISGEHIRFRPVDAAIGVSISQSRCLSFQDGGRRTAPRLLESFNLAIEMLVISGQPSLARSEPPYGFNLAIEMLVISGARYPPQNAYRYLLFQSRNRDACHFRNLQPNLGVHRRQVSISQSRCLSFQVCRSTAQCCFGIKVSISQSRCLSFQGESTHLNGSEPHRFNLAIEMLVISGACSVALPGPVPPVSISQSRCLSFQVFQAGRPACFCFNLAIEMLIISGQTYRPTSKYLRRRFNLAIEMLIISGETHRVRRENGHASFNLAIEMLIISGQEGQG